MNKKALVLFIISSMLLIGCTTTDLTSTTEGTTQQGTIKIGVIVPLSGDASVYGIEAQYALNYQLDKINKNLEASEKQIELIYEDGKCTGSDAASAFQKLTDVDNVNIILGGLCSSETLGMAPLSTNKEILTISAMSSSPEIEQASPYVFSLALHDNMTGTAIADEMKNYKKVAIITEQSDFNIAIGKVWEEKIQEFSNVEIVANEIFTAGESDFRNILAKVQKSNPEAIFLNPNIGITAGNLLKQLAEIENWEDKDLFTHIVYLPNSIRESSGDVSEGMVIIDSPTSTTPELEKILEEIKEQYGATETIGAFFTTTSLDTLNIAVDMAVEFDDDTEKMQQAMRKRTFDGYSSKTGIYFGKNSFPQNIEMGKYIIQDGKAIYQD